MPEPVGELGRLLALMHDAAPPEGIVAMTVRVWTDRKRARDAERRFETIREAAEEDPLGFLGDIGRELQSFVSQVDALTEAFDAGEPPHTAVTSRYWWAERGRLRREEHDDGSFAVAIDELWWLFEPVFGVSTNAPEGGESRAVADELARLCEPGRWLGSLILTPAGRVAVAGRDALRVDAVPRVGATDLAGLGEGLDRVTLAVDAETGFVLASESFFDGKPFMRREVLAFDLDSEAPDGLFVFAPPGKESTEAAFSTQGATSASTTPADEVLDTIAQASRRVGYTVFVPSDEATDTVINDVRLIGDHRSVHARGVLDGGGASFSLLQQPVKAPDIGWNSDGPWRRVETAERGPAVHLRDADAAAGLPAAAKMRRSGTLVVAESQTADPEALARMLAGLVPVEPAVRRPG